LFLGNTLFKFQLHASCFKNQHSPFKSSPTHTYNIAVSFHIISILIGSLFTTIWCILRLQIGETTPPPPDMEGSYEYLE
jgi:hypothetical protein